MIAAVRAVNREPSDADRPSELDFRFKGGDLALNFVATVGERWRANIERLRSPSDLDRWCAEAGLGRPARPADNSDLARARDLREALHRAVRSTMCGTGMDVADRRGINEWARTADIPPQLTAGGCIERTGPSSVEAVLATVARAAVMLLGGADADRLRECASDNCSTLFVDTSRAAARQWCSKRCADRVNAHRYRRRHRSAT
jgi:predicted RNA-binding Zn ribbon-like protein